MARSLLERKPATPSVVSPLSHISPRSPWVFGFLALLTLVALIAAYSVRPSVSIDIGDYYDSAFVENFHGREVDTTGSGPEYPWPAESRTLTIPGGHEGLWVATLHASDGLDDSVLDDVAVSINGSRANIPRRPPRQLVAFVTPEAASGNEIRIDLVPPIEGDPAVATGLVKSVSLSPARTYRWTRGESMLHLPGLGGGDWRLDMTVVTANPANKALNARISANDTQIASLPDGMSDRRIGLLIPASAVASGDLDLIISTDPFTTTFDPRQLGIFISDMSLQPAGSGSLIPPLANTLWALVIVLGVYFCLSRLGNSAWPGLIGALAVLGLGTWALVSYRFPSSFMLPRLGGLVIWSVLVLLLLERALAWLLPADEFVEPSAPSTPSNPILAWAYRLSLTQVLLFIFLISYWVKAGGMLYPYFIGIDVAWHMDRVLWLLNGRFLELYGINSPLNESTMPLAEWGNTKPVIPYSPYFHIFSVAYTVLPFSLSTTANMVSAFIDSLRIILIALMAVYGGLGKRTALFGGLLYAVLPAMYLLHSWGNVPTTTGLWWTLATATFMVVFWQRLGERWALISLAILMLLSMLVYTVAAFFMGIFMVFFTIGIWFWGKELRSGLKPLWIATMIAFAVSLLVYYGQYIPPIIERTIPYFMQSFTSSNESIGKASDTWSAYFARHTRLWNYGFVAPLIFSALYFALNKPIDRALAPLAPIPNRESGFRLITIMIGAWCALMVLFIPLAYKVSMVDKHFFIAVPFMMLASGAVLTWLTQRSWLWRGAALVLYVYLAASAIDLWLTRIAIVRQ
jgi:hypothetical protein